MKLTVRRTYTIVDTLHEESGRAGDPPLRKVAAIAIVANPHAGGYVEDLKPMIEASVALGHQLAEAAVAALAPYTAQDALYVRSHYDGMSVNLPDAPMPDEIAVIFCVANRGRINARVGGLKLSDAKGQDGLT